jgi:hypothetical protein
MANEKKNAKSAGTRGGARKAVKGSKGPEGGKGTKGGKGTGGGKRTQPPRMASGAAPGPQFTSAVPPFNSSRVASDVEGMAIFIDLSGTDRAALLTALDAFAQSLTSDNSIIVMYKGPRPKLEE